jgi:uncharacterized membrane protein YgcG
MREPPAPSGRNKRPRNIGIVVAVLLMAAALIFLVPRAPAPPASPERPDTVFVDKAGLVSPKYVEETSKWLYAIKLFEGVVYIDGKPPEGVLQPWTVQTATEWGVGRAREDRGLVLFVFRDARVVRAEIGYGLEGALPDVTVRRLLESLVVPAFARGDYEAGFEAFIKTVYEKLGGDAEASRQATEEASKPNNPWGEMWSDAWKNGARLLPAVWHAFSQGSVVERIGIVAFALPILFFSVMSLVALAASIQMLIQFPRKLCAFRTAGTSGTGAKPAPAQNAGQAAQDEIPAWLRGTSPKIGAFLLLVPVFMGVFLAGLSGAIAVMVFSMAPDSITRQGKFGGGGVEVQWPVPAQASQPANPG